MLLDQKEDRILSTHERAMIVAYLSYALDDVRAVSEVGADFLQMAIVALTDEAVIDTAGRPLHTAPTH